MGASSAVGRYGEDAADRYLRSCGWTVLERNWRSREGEIDLVALDGDCLVVVEVKTRRGSRFGDPVEAITRDKAARLRRLAASWLSTHDRPYVQVRIDAIGITIPSRGGPQIDHRQGVA